MRFPETVITVVLKKESVPETKTGILYHISIMTYLSLGQA